MPRKTRSDKGKRRNKPYNGGKKRKKARPHKVGPYNRGAFPLGDLWGTDRGKPIKAGKIWGKE